MLTKSQQLLYQLIKETGGVDDKTVLAKLQYFSDFIHFAFYNKPISNEEILYTKQKMGPLSRTLTEDLEELKKAGYIKEEAPYSYSPANEVETSLNGKELKTIKYVVQKYSKLDYKELVDICHQQPPYLSAENGGVIELFTAYNLVDEYGDYKYFS